VRTWSFSAVLLAAAAAASFATGDNWPQWRGPDSSAVSTGRGVPLEWSATKNVRWRAPIAGRGHSSPILWEGRIFLTTSIEGERVRDFVLPKHTKRGRDFAHAESVGGDRAYTLAVLCLDAGTGRVLWQRVAHQGRVSDNRHAKNTYASATPATDGRHVYAYFGSEGAYCYDFEGNLIWKKQVGQIAHMGLGNGTSPVVSDRHVFLQCDQDEGEGSFLVALDKRTGAEVWRVERQARAAWTTPLLLRSGGSQELVCNGAEAVIAYDPATGKEVWRAPGVEGHAIPTPVAGHGMVFASAGKPVRKTLAIRQGGTGVLTGAHIAWQYDRGTGEVPSEILYGRYLYLMTDTGLLTCLDALSGEVKYAGARVPVPATFFASPVAFEGKLLLCSEDGDVFVIKAGPEHEVLRTNSMGEPIFASPAISGSELFIRTEKALYCIRAAGR